MPKKLLDVINFAEATVPTQNSLFNDSSWRPNTIDFMDIFLTWPSLGKYVSIVA